MTFEDKLSIWLDRRKQNRLVKRFGGIQKCPWCRQWAQYGDGWHFDADTVNPALDVLTCGVCSGTSLWVFALGFLYVGPKDPPPAHPTVRGSTGGDRVGLGGSNSQTEL